MAEEKLCPPGHHDDQPIIEGDQTVGLVCMICGRSVREDMTISNHAINDRGFLEGPIVEIMKRMPHRKDPRF